MNRNSMFQRNWDDHWNDNGTSSPDHTDTHPHGHSENRSENYPQPPALGPPLARRNHDITIAATPTNDTTTAISHEAEHNDTLNPFTEESPQQPGPNANTDNPPGPTSGTTPAQSATPAAETPPVPDYHTRHTLNHDSLTKHRADIPQHGWRRALYTTTAGLINPGIGDTEKARQQLRERVRRRLHAPHRVAVLSVKGGIGKTTLTACIGFSMAETRGDQIAVIDANPDAGTLADRLTGDSSVNIRHLLHDLDKLDALTDVTSYMSLAGRLKVLASDQDPATSEALTAHEYQRATQLLSKYFNLVFTDCGTGISHATMTPTLEMAHTVIVIGSPTIDGASRAGHTLDWLNTHGYTTHADNAIIVLNHKDTSRDVDTTRITEHFTTRARAVIHLPHDPHLASGGKIDFHRLRPHTTDALTEIGAHIADQFPTPHTT